MYAFTTCNYRTTVLEDRNFIMRMLYSDYLHLHYSILHVAFVIDCVTAFYLLFY